MPPARPFESAYRAARYRVHAAAGIVELEVGARSPALDALLAAAGARRWAWLTAVNPGSRRLPPGENRARLARLDAELAGAALRALPGTAVDPARVWPDEVSRFVLDLEVEAARALALRFGQLAFLAGEAGGEVRLEWTGPVGG